MSHYPFVRLLAFATHIELEDQLVFSLLASKSEKEWYCSENQIHRETGLHFNTVRPSCERLEGLGIVKRKATKWTAVEPPAGFLHFRYGAENLHWSKRAIYSRYPLIQGLNKHARACLAFLTSLRNQQQSEFLTQGERGDYSYRGLSIMFCCENETIAAAFKELDKQGYIEITPDGCRFVGYDVSAVEAYKSAKFAALPENKEQVKRQQAAEIDYSYGLPDASLYAAELLAMQQRAAERRKYAEQITEPQVETEIDRELAAIELRKAEYLKKKTMSLQSQPSI